MLVLKLQLQLLSVFSLEKVPTKLLTVALLGKGRKQLLSTNLVIRVEQSVRCVCLWKVKDTRALK